MGKFGIKDAESLIGLVRETIGIKEGVIGIFMDIRHILMQLEAERRFISEIEAEMGASLERIPWSGRLLSIKGLGYELHRGGNRSDCSSCASQDVQGENGASDSSRDS